MQMSREDGFRTWIAHWGFAILVGLAVLVATYVAWKVKVPSEIPDFALNAAAVYRVEVGAAAFLGLYLVAMAFVLALNNRGFSEIGVNGLKAQDITEKAQRGTVEEHENQLKMLWHVVETFEDSTNEPTKETFCRREV